jgi:hypothetical protein
MGLWEQVQEQFSDLKETVIGEIKNMVVTQVITAGVKWIIGLLNPASAFVKAAMAIYDIIMFFVNRGSQVLELVNSIVDAVAAIASGAVGGAAKLVENALSRALPVVIGFMASLLGVGGLAKKVEKIIGRIRQRIDKAIDKILLKAKKLFKGKKGKGNKDGKFTEKNRKTGLAAFEKEEKPFVKDGAITQADAYKVGKIVKDKHPVFKSITVVDGKDSWDYKYVFRNDDVDTTSKKAENSSMPLRFPNNRHFISGLSIPKAAGNSLFTIDKSLVQVDVDEINDGKANKTGNTFNTSSGRIYGFHDDILYPISGPGIEQLSSQEYKLLKQFKKDENKAMQTMNILVSKGFIPGDRANLVKKIAQYFGLTS